LRATIKVAFASGTDELNRLLVERMQALYPELPLYVVSEFPPSHGVWVPYHVGHGLRENLGRCRAAFAGKRIRLGGVLLVPQVPYRRMRLIALLLSPLAFLGFNEQLDSFMLRPHCAGVIAQHLLWRVRNWLRWEVRRWRSRDWKLWWQYWCAVIAGWAGCLMRATANPARSLGHGGMPALTSGLSVVIPSRNGGALLDRLLPGLLRELAGFVSEIIVVDNGSEEMWEHPAVTVLRHAEPLSFARAVNLGIRRAQYSHICLLNNDMVLEPGFFAPLLLAFDRIPDLFCATAQILFPAGVRREETGKAFFGPPASGDFPVRCDLPIPGEDHTWVLYGSGGCSLCYAPKLRALGCMSETYSPAYVEDLDLGYRAWQRGWPTVFVAAARVEHRHRATTSRYYTEEQLASVLETNYLRFLSTAVVSPRLYYRLWTQAIGRLRLLGDAGHLAAAAKMALDAPRFTAPAFSEERILALNSGDVAVFPGRAAATGATVLIASPYLPFPLSHGAAVRIYNLMRRATRYCRQVLVAFADRLDTPPPELLDLCAEIVLVKRTGSHSLPSGRRPETVEEFDSTAFHAAVELTARKWNPAVAQLEFTQMAQYAADCTPAHTILVEHDITFDLYEQLLALSGDWHTRRQLERWHAFETDAWRRVDRVVTMSEKDRTRVQGAPAVTLPNGVDLARFRPSAVEPEAARLLFIGSFAHRPNVMAAEFFVSEVWPRIQDVQPMLHIIAGARHESYAIAVKLEHPRILLEGFVADVRPAYERAGLVIAPLPASAGTNIKILEAMAMGKAIVSTPAGINGLDLTPGEDVIVAGDSSAMAAAILELLADPGRRRALGERARATVERRYDWNAIADRQEKLYRDLREQ
jgi:glycosyltransferase involved in cell wall biosynthesis/GT2 family glycosyltransferase